jgi:hypothetical protein
METSEEGWVTGPALVTALALGAIRPGDMVRVKNLKSSFGDKDESGHADVGVVGTDCLPTYATIESVREAVLNYRVCFWEGAVPGSWWIWKPSEVVGWKPQKRGTNS